jgi:hypothetical protein
MSVQRRNVPDEERAIELLEQLSVIDSHRDFLEDVGDDMFRLKHVKIDFSDLCVLRSAFVVEDSGREMGSQIDWQLTDSARYLLHHVPESVTVTDDEVDAILGAGVEIFNLPPSRVDRWRVRSLEEVQLAPHTLAKLREAELIEAKSEPTGHPTWWASTQRLDEIRRLLAGIVSA